MKKYTILLLLLVYSYFVLRFSAEITKGIIKSISVCINVIIPSLFAFMIFSGIIIKSGAFKLLGVPFERFARTTFGISGELFSVFLISSVGGYPIGAKLIKNLYLCNQVNKATAERMLTYCYLGGPAFFIGVVGNNIYGDAKVGVIIFLSILTTNIILGFLFRCKNTDFDKKNKEISVNISFDDVIGSINSGGLELIKICAVIIFFSTFLTIFESLGINSYIAKYISELSNLSFGDSSVLVRSIFDITNIGEISSKMELIPVITSLLSFGGICIIFQLEGIIGNHLNRRKFYISRVISVIISYPIAVLYMKLFSVNETYIHTFYSSLVKTHHFSPLPFLILLILTIFVISTNNHKKTNC